MPGEPSLPPEEPRLKYRELPGESGSTATSGSKPRYDVLPYVVLLVVTFLVTWFALATITGFPVGLGPSPISHSGTATPGVVLTINNPFDTARNSSTDQYRSGQLQCASGHAPGIHPHQLRHRNNPVTPLQASVNGTVANCIYLNATPAKLGTCVHSVPTGFVAHTFSFLNGTYAGFNVPLVSAIDSPEGGIGASVTFFTYFNVTGTFYWHCLSPCDPFSMATGGFMLGTMTVVPRSPRPRLCLGKRGSTRCWLPVEKGRLD